MKCRLSRLQFSDQRLNPFNRDLIANRQAYSPVMLDLFVEFFALVAHGNLLEPRVPTPHWSPDGKKGWNGNLFPGPLSIQKGSADD